MGQNVTDLFFYKWRYVLGYGFVVLSIIALFLMAFFYIPGGLTEREMNSAVESSSIGFTRETFEAGNILNLPYHLLQRASLELFGISNFSIKLPSLILALLSAAGLLLLLRTWFRQNVAVITTLVVITTGQLLFIAQSGTSSIMYIFTSVWMLLAAMKLSRHANLSGIWMLILAATTALSLYTTLSAYAVIALLSATMLHPHLRYLVRKLPKVQLFFASLFALVVAAPLVYAIVLDLDLAKRLLGIPETMPNLAANVSQLFNQYFNFTEPGTQLPMAPVYSLGTMILLGIGVIRLFATKYTARSYIITAWSVLLLPILLLNPSYTTVTFVPAVLLIGLGVNALLSYWYRLFPRNPYARLAGLLPLTILIGGLMFSGVDRYVYGYSYYPEARAQFTNDASLLNRELSETSGAIRINTSPDEAEFYRLLIANRESVSVQTTSGVAPTGVTFVTQAAHEAQDYQSDTPKRILTDGRSSGADRFYIYKSTGN